MSCLKTLCVSGKWKDLDIKYKKYKETCQFVSDTLKQCFHKGSNLGEETYTKKFSDNGIITKILKAESHRHCTVLFCEQYDKETDGLRFIVYGEGHEEFLDYGIGTDLGRIDKEYSLKYCPDYITAKFLDL